MKTYLNTLLVVLALASSASAADSTRYLAFQIFTGSFNSPEMRQGFPPRPDDLHKTVIDLRDRIGVTSSAGRRLAFVLGPIALDNTDEEVRSLIATGFNIALATDVAVGFHLDDSMFWGRRMELNTPENLEWLDWKGTLNTSRRLDWSSKPLKVMPQLCINSQDVRKAVTKLAVLTGHEIAEGVKKLHTAGKDDLFLGVIAGWETQIGRDFATRRPLGYHALTNAGYSAASSLAELDTARIKIVQDFVGFWAQSLANAGVPKDKLYSHIAYMSETLYRVARRVNPAAMNTPYLERINFTPPAAAFCDLCIPGFSTYPQPGHLEQWQAELAKHGNPPWASCEGTAIDPGEAERTGRGMSMEHYLGNLFNHGAVLVNIFGWRVGDQNNPFRKIAESDNAIAAYRKFLHSEKLAEAPLPIPALPPEGLQEKIHKVQAMLPGWIEKNGPARVKDNVEKLGRLLKAKQFTEAAATADAILKTIAN